MDLARQQDQEDKKVEFQFDRKAPVHTGHVWNIQVVLDHGQVGQIQRQGNVVARITNENQDQSSESDGYPIGGIEPDDAGDGESYGVLFICRKKDDKTA